MRRHAFVTFDELLQLVESARDVVEVHFIGRVVGALGEYLVLEHPARESKRVLVYVGEAEARRLSRLKYVYVVGELRPSPEVTIIYASAIRELPDDAYVVTALESVMLAERQLRESSQRTPSTERA